jgi:competence protein CoiA
MLCAKQKSTGEIVTAYLASKINAPFFCPVCGDEVILKSGATKVNYFAHKNPLVCRYDANESEDHRQCKFQIYQALLREPNVEKATMERPLGTNRPDVSAYINGVPVAIEIQISSLSEETIKFRTMEYARKGIYVLWLLLWTPDLNDTRYAPRLWEKWIHATYFGHVYYWIEGLSIVSYHFEPSLKSVPRKSFYSADGKKITAGGYSRRSKRHRMAIRDGTLNLVKDFVPKDRDWWEGNGITIPFAKLFMERRKIASN